MSLEALWSIYFGDENAPHDFIPGASNAGTLVFETGRVLGGDSQYYYTGHFKNEGGNLVADVHVRHFNGQPSTAFGTTEKNFWVRAEATWQTDTEIRGKMFRKEAPDRALPIYLVYRAPLP